MKILVNKKIKDLFFYLFFSMIFFISISIIFVLLKFKYSTLIVLSCFLFMNIFVLILLYNYFKTQNKIINNASNQIKDYISGNQNIQIESDEEGDLYRLFHEVNSLVSILNAHIENEKKTKNFLKNSISDISHQLKTPLAALNIYNGLIQDESNDFLNIKEFAILSEKELDRIEILVKNLLKITKLDSKTISLEKSEQNISDMITFIYKKFEFRFKQEYKKFKLFGDDDLTLFCDRNWFIEAISNIVKNSLDHTKNENLISIKWTKFTSIIQIIISDNGTGIHPEDISHIFKRFYRSRFSKDSQGIGLGLAITKSIVEAHGGTIEVESELGFGTTFKINFLIPTKL